MYLILVHGEIHGLVGEQPMNGPFRLTHTNGEKHTCGEAESLKHMASYLKL